MKRTVLSQRATPITSSETPAATPLLRGETPKPQVPYTPNELQEAELLVRQTHDAMASGDRPGRYFDQREPGDIKTSFSKGGGAGTWRGVSSMRTMLPWIKDTNFTPSQLERALRPEGNAYLRERILNSAAEFIRGEKAKKAQ